MLLGYTIIDDTYGHFVQMAILFLFLLVFAVIDIRKRVIPNKLIILMAACGLCALILSFDLAYILTGAVTFFLIGAILFVISWLTKEALGMGDAKLIMCSSLFLGAAGTMGFLFFSFLCASVFSIVLLLLKKGDRKTLLPLAPFLLAGLLMQILL